MVYQDGVLLPGYSFQTPVTITVQYTQEEVGWADEEQIRLMLFDDLGWSDAALTCEPPSEYSRDTLNNAVRLPICHLSLFGVFGPTRPPVYTFSYLPIIKK
jgi:hypothetical protein